jgi:hypothetical protein
LRPSGTRVNIDISFFERLLRIALNPQTCVRPGPYRSDLKGMASSADHPPSNRPVFTSQTGFQSWLNCRSPVTCVSDRPPMGLTVNITPLRWS